MGSKCSSVIPIYMNNHPLYPISALLYVGRHKMEIAWESFINPHLCITKEIKYLRSLFLSNTAKRYFSSFSYRRLLNSNGLLSPDLLVEGKRN